MVPSQAGEFLVANYYIVTRAHEARMTWWQTTFMAQKMFVSELGFEPGIQVYHGSAGQPLDHFKTSLNLFINVIVSSNYIFINICISLLLLRYL